LRRKDISLFLRHVVDLNQLLMPSVYTSWGNQGPSIMTISSALGGLKMPARRPEVRTGDQRRRAGTPGLILRPTAQQFSGGTA
jgi:hypothetical protein